MIILTALGTVMAALIAYKTFANARVKDMKDDAVAISDRIKTVENDMKNVKEKQSFFEENYHRQWDYLSKTNATITDMISELTAQREIQNAVKDSIQRMSNKIDSIAILTTELTHVKEDISDIKKKINL